MKTIIRGRDSGKARELLQAASKANAMVLTTNKRALQGKANSYGITDVLIIDFDDLKYDNYPLDKPLMVHNGDKVLYYLFDKYYGIEVCGFTATEEDNA